MIVTWKKKKKKPSGEHPEKLQSSILHLYLGQLYFPFDAEG